MVQSQTITYDYTFVNNTKNYTFIDNATSKTYVIKVDYSSIKVPVDPMKLLNETIAKYNQTINEKNSVIENLTMTINYQNETIVNLTENLQDALAENMPLQNRITSLLVELDDFKNRTVDLNIENNIQQQTIEKQEDIINKEENVIHNLMTDSWLFFYTYISPLTNKNTNIIIWSWPSFLIALFISISLVVFVSKRKKIGEKLNRGSKTLADLKELDKEIIDGFTNVAQGTPESLKKMKEKPVEKKNEKETTKKYDDEKTNEMYNQIDNLLFNNKKDFEVT